MPKPNDMKNALRIIPMLYDAALNGWGWERALNALSEVFGAATANINIGRVSTREVLHAYTTFDDPKLRESYLRIQNLAVSDPRNTHLSRFLNQPVRRIEIVDDEEWYRSEFYQKVLEPHGLDDVISAALVAPENDIGIAIAFVRYTSDPPFSKEDADILSLYIPHLQQISKFVSQRLENIGAISVLSGIAKDLNIGAIVVDRFCKIIFCNNIAKEYLSEQEVVYSRGDVLEAKDPRYSKLLKEYIFDTSVAHAEADNGLPLPRNRMMISGKNEGRKFFVSIHQGRNVSSEGETPLNLSNIYIVPAKTEFFASKEKIQGALGLTDAELDVSLHHLDGKNLRETSEKTGRTYETVRTHMKNAMAKAEVNRQADFTRVCFQIVSSY